MTNIFQTIYEGLAVEIKYTFNRRAVHDAWIVQDIEFNISKVFLIAVLHHIKVIKANYILSSTYKDLINRNKQVKIKQ